jgi:addiction module HigA family antidote
MNKKITPKSFFIQSPPGDSLSETLLYLGMTQAELAKRTGRPKKTINEIIKGKAAITPDTAIQLERVLGTTASFWNNRENDFRQSLAWELDRDELLEQLEWMDRLPAEELISLGWIERHEDEYEQMNELLKFYGIASPSLWMPLWVESIRELEHSPAFEGNTGNVTAWMRKGELEAQNISCQPYNQTLVRELLQTFRERTIQPVEWFFMDLQRSCAQAGIALCVIPELPASRLVAAARWMSPQKALIQLSDRLDSDAAFWFAFYRAAGHLLLHGKRETYLEEPVIESNEKSLRTAHFALRTLLPDVSESTYSELAVLDARSLEESAQAWGISPGILVECLQFEGHLPHGKYAHLKLKLDWDEVISDLPKPETEADEYPIETLQPSEQPAQTTGYLPWPGFSDAATRTLQLAGLESEAGQKEELLFANWFGSQFANIESAVKQGYHQDAMMSLRKLHTEMCAVSDHSPVIDAIVQMLDFLVELLQSRTSVQADAVQDLSNVLQNLIVQVNQPTKNQGVSEFRGILSAASTFGERMAMEDSEDNLLYRPDRQ